MVDDPTSAEVVSGDTADEAVGGASRSTPDPAAIVCGPRARAAMAVTRAWTAVTTSPTNTPRAAPVTPQTAANPMVQPVRTTASRTRLTERSR